MLAQRRQLQEARSIIKSGKNYDQAEKMMTKLLKDSANLHKPRIYEMWLTSVEKQYDQVNEAMADCISGYASGQEGARQPFISY